MTTPVDRSHGKPARTVKVHVHMVVEVDVDSFGRNYGEQTPSEIRNAIRTGAVSAFDDGSVFADGIVSVKLSR